MGHALTLPLADLQLASLDIALVVLYLLAVAALGLWFARGITSGRDLFLAGKSLPWWAVGTSLVVSDIGAKDMVGLATDGYRYGMVMANFDFLGCIFPVLIAAFLFMPFLWMAGVYTVPEYLGLRYNRFVRTAFALIWGIFMIGLVGIVFVSAGSMFTSLLGWSFWFSVGICAVLVGLYTAIGGLKAVVVTDFISCIVLIIGATLICTFGLIEVGGWSALREQVAQYEWAETHFDLLKPADDPDFAWPAVVLGLGFVLGPAYWIGNQAIVQRNFGSRSQNEARASYVFCAALKLIFPLLLVLPGLIGIVLLGPELGDPRSETWQGNDILPQLVVRLLPTGVLGIVLGAFLAGVMSNLDSYINSASTLWVKDIYQPFFRPHASEREFLWVGRLLIIVFLIGGLFGAYWVDQRYPSVFEAFQSFMSIFQGPLFALMLLGMTTRWTTSGGGVIGMLAGLLTALILHTAENWSPLLWDSSWKVSYLWVAWWSFAASMIGITIGSMFTPRYDDDRLRGLVCWLPVSSESEVAGR
jgi:SSS family solute:Na+ symporter